jgi:hypothetical protein
MSDQIETIVEADGDDAPKLRTKCGVMPASHHARYTANGGGCADVLDVTMRDRFTIVVAKKPVADVEGLKATAIANGVWNPAWEGLNPGMIRMNTANRLRGLLRRGKSVTLLPTEGEAETGTFGVLPTTLMRAEAEAEEKAARKAEREADAAAKREAKAATKPAPKTEPVPEVEPEAKKTRGRSAGKAKPKTKSRK